MNTPRFFVDELDHRSYHLHNTNIQLDIQPEVFPPSDFVIPFANEIKINKGEKVIDIGTGSGFLAILAAKLGAEVYATDISLAAIQNTELNAEANKVKVTTSLGSYFADLSDKYDVIIANLPQEILPLNLLEDFGHKRSMTIDGGLNGNEILINFLEIVPDFMNKKSRLYIHIGSLSDYKDSLGYISKNFNARMLNAYALPNKYFVAQNISFYKQLNQEGKINIFNQNDQWMSIIYSFELSLK